jgi:hypothetical protein
MPSSVSSSRKARTSWIVVGGLVICGAVAVLAAWQHDYFSLPVNDMRGRCMSNLNQLALAVRSYEGKHGHLPAASMTVKGGGPPHSWRVAILPLIGRKDLLLKYDFDQPWNSPKNRALAVEMPDEFRCPNATRNDGAKTHYMMLVGKNAVGGRPGDKGLRLDQLAGDPSTKLLLVEVPGPGVDWMEPKDITVDELIERLQTAKAPHVNGFSVAFCDSVPRLLPMTIGRETLRHMADIRDRTSVDVNGF